jgi:hypothetical protein
VVCERPGEHMTSALLELPAHHDNVIYNTDQREAFYMPLESNLEQTSTNHYRPDVARAY